MFIFVVSIKFSLKIEVKFSPAELLPVNNLYLPLFKLPQAFNPSDPQNIPP